MTRHRDGWAVTLPSLFLERGENMDRMIQVQVDGHHLTKDNRVAGVQGESNATVLRIEFDPGWDGVAKKVTFWDANGRNPVERTLTANLLEDAEVSTRIYLCPIPGEAMAETGEMTFVIDGWVDGKRQRSLPEALKVLEAPFINQAAQPADPTPTQAEQLQVQIDTLLGDMQERAVRAETAADEAVACAEQAAASEASAEQAAKNASRYEQGAEAAKDLAEAYCKKASVAAQAANGVTYITVTENDDGTYTADMTYADAYAALLAGKSLMARYDRGEGRIVAAPVVGYMDGEFQYIEFGTVSGPGTPYFVEIFFSPDEMVYVEMFPLKTISAQ